MKLLILTQKVDINDDVLGFFHDWIFEFARNCEKVTVICLYKGEYDLPSNVKVLSLGKELDDSKFKIGNSKLFIKLKFIFLFYKYIWQERNNYDSVFVHMNQIYVLLGGVFWRFFNKKVNLWYAHGSISFGLKIALLLSNNIFTSTKSGFRLNSEKVKIVGQGIDINKFKRSEFLKDNVFRILFVGRISPVKDIKTLIQAIEIICHDKELINIKFQVDIVGGVGLKEQENYFNELKEMIIEKKLDKVINFIGPVPSFEVIKYLRKADFFVNTSHTGSLDKVILEAMACEVIIASCNESLLDIFDNDYKNKLMFKKKDYVNLARIIKEIVFMEEDERKKIGLKLREIVVLDHSLNKLIKNIILKMIK